MRVRFVFLIFALLVAAVAATTIATAARAGAASDWARNDHAAVRLVAAGPPGADGALSLGVEFDLRPGWHIYWRAPGDAGIAPTVDWSGSHNFDRPEMRWPLPSRYTIFGLTTYVYGGNVVLPVDAHVPSPGEPVALRATVNYLVCEKICIPYDATLALDIPTGAAGGPQDALAVYRERVPAPVEGGSVEATLGVREARLVQAADGTDGLALEVLASSAMPFADPDVIVEGPSGLRFGVPSVELSADRRLALFRLPAVVAGERALAGTPLTVTLADRGAEPVRAVEIRVVAEAAAGVSGGHGLMAILAFALLGGLILNLMPCVLPVLSLKLLSVVGHVGEAAAVRRGFIATAAGIVFSFLLLAAGAVALKATGAAVGWGIQFQSPLFLGLMGVVITIFAANLFGFFHIALPGFAGRLAGGGREGSLGGAFATGAFATLLATPCSAPFLGTAVGFALTRGYGEILAVFLVLGIGLALPYLVVAAFPALARALPRPGRWMVWLRMVLGLALVATAIWLAFIIDVVAGRMAALASGAALAGLLAVFAAARYGRLPTGAMRAGLAGLALAAALMPAALARPGGTAGAEAETIPWRPFDKVALYNLVAEGRTVFVDVTADWCVTCKANKTLVIDRRRVAGLLTSGEVIPMRADWTRPDPAISAYLESFGRFGIPFNAVYGPARPSGIALPELLTERAVLEAVMSAGKPAGAE